MVRPTPGLPSQNPVNLNLSPHPFQLLASSLGAPTLGAQTLQPPASTPALCRRPGPVSPTPSNPRVSKSPGRGSQKLLQPQHALPSGPPVGHTPRYGQQGCPFQGQWTGENNHT